MWRDKIKIKFQKIVQAHLHFTENMLLGPVSSKQVLPGTSKDLTGYS